MSADKDFCCAICQRNVDMRWNHTRSQRIIPPICIGCEHDYSRGLGKPSHGTFRDRRNVMRGLALAEALRCEAGRQTWSVQYGRA